MLQNVAVQWLIRRVPEILGIISGIVAFIGAAPPEVQAVAMAVLTGQGGGLSIVAYFGVVSWVFGQINSYRATVKPQAIVEENGHLVTNTLAPSKEKQVADVVVNVSSKKTLLEILLGK